MSERVCANPRSFLRTYLLLQHLLFGSFQTGEIRLLGSQGSYALHVHIQLLSRAPASSRHAAADHLFATMH